MLRKKTSGSESESGESESGEDGMFYFVLIGLWMIPLYGLNDY